MHHTTQPVTTANMSTALTIPHG